MSTPNDPQGAPGAGNEPQPNSGDSGGGNPPEGGAGGGTPDGYSGSSISNSDLKAHPVFQKMASELGKLQQAEADRAKAEQEAKTKAERERLEAEGNYKAALELRDSQLKEQQEKYEKDLLQRDLKLELATAGFTNEVFLSGALAGYQGDAAGVADYVKELAGKEENKVFLGNSGQQGRDRLPAPDKPGNSGAGMTVEQAKVVANDQTQSAEVRAQAREVIGQYFDKHGSMP